MNKKSKIYIISLFAVFSLIIILQHFAPQPPNWIPNYNMHSKDPYGCMVTNDMLSIIFPNQKIDNNSNSLYISLKKADKTNTNLIIITKAFAPDALDLEQLLEYVAKGNNAFISSTAFSEELSDTLNFKTSIEDFSFDMLKNKQYNLRLNLPNKDSVDYKFNKQMPMIYFKNFNSITTDAIGFDDNKKANLIKVKFGSGTFYIHTLPLALTNYHILYDNHKYASNVLSYLPIAETTWDQYYKPGNGYNTTPVRYILSEAPLKAAYFITIISILLYLLLGGKRKQQIIPIIKPLQNDTLSFAQTIGRLYFKSRNNADLANKKITYFNDFLRRRYNTSIPKDDAAISRLAAKSGVDFELIEILSQQINYIRQKENINPDTLIRVHKIIEEFKNKCI